MFCDILVYAFSFVVVAKPFSGTRDAAWYISSVKRVEKPVSNLSPIEKTRSWVESFVVGLNLCPFAKKELVNNRIRFCLTNATTEIDLLVDLKMALELLQGNTSIETTLLIHPSVLTDFTNYNQFLGQADELLITLNLEGVFQIASFHPDYQFADTNPDDAENYTNRSPFPMLHLLREESLDKAIEHYDDVDLIPVRNIAKMNEIGIARLKALLI